MRYLVFASGWNDSETRSGYGSRMEFTNEVRQQLPQLIMKYQIRKINDAGCGDLNWISKTNLKNIDYKGYDVTTHSEWSIKHEFSTETLDFVNNDMRSCDLIICRDVFIHLPNDDIQLALQRFRRQGRLLLSTSFEWQARPHEDDYNVHPFPPSYQPWSNDQRIAIPSRTHSKLDLSQPPFDLGPPIERIEERYPRKYLGLWYL